MKKISIYKDPYGTGDIYSKNAIEIEEGVTVLVGCNGSGKTTLLRQLKQYLEKHNIPFVSYDNLHDGGEHARSLAIHSDMDFFATSFVSSEGENIALNLNKVARDMGALSRKYPDSEEMWFLFDAVDSGLSIDNIMDVKQYLFETVLEYNKDKRIYIIVSANEYEMCCGEKCFDTYLCEYVDINSYEDYRNVILKSRENKDKREYKTVERKKRRQ